MELASPRASRRNDSILPMINVVFLLLIFFVILAEIAPPSPFDVAPPEAEGARAVVSGPILFVGANGELGFNGATGDDAAFAALAAYCAGTTCQDGLTIRADRNLSGAQFASLLVRLSKVGISSAELVTTQP